LKQRFGMSLQALVYRLHDLGIISDSHYRQWFTDINRLHRKKQEPSELPPEQPQWLRKSVLRAMAEELLTQEDGMKMLGESMKMNEPVSLVERRAFMKLPLVDRRKIMARQAKEMAAHYEKDVSWKDIETWGIVND
jgi:hypothetical protein